MTSTPLELVGLPEGGPTSMEQVVVWLDIDTEDPARDAQLATAIAAVNNVVRGLRVSAAAVDADAWPPSIELGATMLAARVFRRKNTTNGVEAFSSEGAAYVSRNDPDIAQLLQLGGHSRIALG